MKRLWIPVLLLGIVSCKNQNNINNQNRGDYPVSPVEFTQVQLEDQFWKPRLDIHKEVTLPSSLMKSRETGIIDNFRIAGGLMDGEYSGVFPFDDSDVYKIIEGASFSLSTNPDPLLSAYIDTIISYIAAAQEPDGYLHTWRTIDPTAPPTTWSGNEKRWSNISGGHELYNLGHMYEAAVAHYRATGKRTFLDVAIKSADLIINTFGPEKLIAVPGHQEIELGLAKLYRVTGDKSYLDMAKFFLDYRGRSNERDELFGEYSQDHIPVTEQSEAVGHAVRAAYMYSAMADIAAFTGDTAYFAALGRIWNNVVGKKIYLTGGIGARHDGESFGDNYELPNFSAYNETCAAIANVMWNHRMFLLTGEAKYIDVLERTLYNGMIVGVSLSGDHFFYPNPLAADGEYKFNRGSCDRSEWFDCSCCPSNVTRFLPSIPGYVYGVKDDKLFINLYMQNSASIEIEGEKMSIRQETAYPVNGKVKVVVSPDKTSSFKLMLRIPGWAQNEVMDGDLYNYINELSDQPVLKINGTLTAIVLEDGYAAVNRNWEKGDVVELELPMEVRQVTTNENVAENLGKSAIEYGPIVYCAEEADNSIDIFSVLEIPRNANFRLSLNDTLLGGVNTIKVEVPYESGNSKQKTISELTLIPYNVWNNRGVGKMGVWFPVE